MEPLPKNTFRTLLYRYYTVNHCLRCVPNIVNCHCEHFELEKYALLPYRSTKPLYFYIESRPTTKTDLALDLVHKKCKYTYDLGWMKKSYVAAKKKKKVRKMLQEGFVTHTVANVINHMETEPDKYFQGGYNWYYTGGCLDVAQIGGYHYIFHVIGEQMSTLAVSRYEVTSSPSFQSCQIRFKEAITEVFYERQLLILRSKSSVFLYKFDSVLLELELLLCCSQEVVPFICATLRDDSDLVCFDLDHVLRVVPLSKTVPERKISLAEHFEGQRDKWSQLVSLPSNPHLCLVVTRSKFLLVNIDKMRCVGSLDISKMNLIASCSEITGIWNSRLDRSDNGNEDDCDLVYLATTHEIFAIRLFFDRKGRGFVKERPIKVCIRWTHQLKSPPLILKSTLFDEDTELIFVSSLVDNSTRVLCVERGQCSAVEKEEDAGDDDDDDEGEDCEFGSRSKKELPLGLHSYYPPFKPVDLATSFSSCLQMGSLTDTRYDIRRRINLSTVGLGIFQGTGDETGDINLLTMNSMGDIYHQKLIAKEGTGVEVEKKEEAVVGFIEEMKRTWEILVDKEIIEESALTVTGVENLRCFFYGAIGELEKEQEEDDTEEELDQMEDSFEKKLKEKQRKERLAKMKRKSKWNRPVGKLRKYKDVLSQDLLAIWDVSDEDDNTDDEEEDEDEAALKRFLQPAEKVSFWLQSTQHNESQKAEETEMEEEWQGNVVTSREVTVNDVQMEEELDSLLDRTGGGLADVSTQQRKSQAKKKSRVKGF